MTRDPNYSPFAPSPGNNQPSARLVEICWRLRGPSSKVLECGIYSDAAPGPEVRCGYGEDDLLRSQRTADIGTARDIAEEWRQAVIAKGGLRRSSAMLNDNAGADVARGGVRWN
jgi:hypothetical protein